VPFTIGFYGSVVFLSIKGAMQDWMVMILLIVPALFHYTPEHATSLIQQAINIVSFRYGGSTEEPRKNEQNGGQ
jgi:hypothetical protein